MRLGLHIVGIIGRSLITRRYPIVLNDCYRRLLLLIPKQYHHTVPVYRETTNGAQGEQYVLTWDTPENSRIPDRRFFIWRRAHSLSSGMVLIGLLVIAEEPA